MLYLHNTNHNLNNINNHIVARMVHYWIESNSKSNIHRTFIFIELLYSFVRSVRPVRFVYFNILMCKTLRAWQKDGRKIVPRRSKRLMRDFKVLRIH